MIVRYLDPWGMLWVWTALSLSGVPKHVALLSSGITVWFTTHGLPLQTQNM